MEELDWMEEARQEAAQCWCEPETSSIEMDVKLAEVVARHIAYWMGVAAQNQRNADYYRQIVERCGRALGEEAYIQDDGGISEDVLCAKVAELLESRLTEATKREITGDKFCIVEVKHANKLSNYPKFEIYRQDAVIEGHNMKVVESGFSTIQEATAKCAKLNAEEK